MKKLVFLFLFPLSIALSAQHAPDELAERWNQASLPWFHQKISQGLSTNKPCLPTFKEQIAAPSVLEQALLTISSNKELEMEYIDLLLSQNCERFLEIQSLADLYFPLLHKHLDRVGMDRDYAFLTMVLSGLNPTFRNKSDQAGLWALDFVNAKRQGLHIDQDIDERRAASLATEATTELLRAYFEVFEMNHIKTIAAHVKGAKWTNARNDSEIVADPEMFQVFTALKVCIRLRGNFLAE
ncbi:MAG: transglycosylase SLT domain-containing protein [Bacteroidetes bacterium]|nr:transglycosylase SLT domain-containing protein [Bacteroidota bacterium]